MAKLWPPAGATRVQFNGCRPGPDGSLDVPEAEVKGLLTAGWTEDELLEDEDELLEDEDELLEEDED